MNQHRYLQYIDAWKAGKEQGQKGPSQTSCHIKRYIVEKFNNTCQGCGITGLWNNKQLTLQLEHINGNSRDQTEENLSLLCPNCHTQTPFYGSKNNGNGRGSLLKNAS
jgi:5-methylcytosine-specific restriction endonuclease McrA